MAKLKKNAFTILELLVAMALLVILLGLSGMVFHTTIQAHRAAGATIDVTRNLRAITDQLKADFRGLRKDAPMAIWFEPDFITGRYHDQLLFFADGDFQSTKQYDSDNDGVVDKTVYGNVARIYYGHPWLADTVSLTMTKNYTDSNLLARRTHILTSDLNLPPYVPSGTPFPDFATFMTGGFWPQDNNFYEYDQATLTDWKNTCHELNGGIALNAGWFLDTCFNNQGTVYAFAGRPKIDYGNYQTLHMLLSQGVLHVQLQWSYGPTDLTGTVNGFGSGIRWWPSDDPAGDGTILVSDFTLMNAGNSFGVYFELPTTVAQANWTGIQNCLTSDGSGGSVNFVPTFYPKALKFTFVLKDSNGLFTDGKRFTHIVYLDN